MKVFMSMKWDGVTLDQYEALRKLVNWEINQPKGGNLHIAGFHNGSLRVTDVWNSVEEFNEFAEKRLMPGVAACQIQGQPQVDLFPIHAIYFPALQL